MSRQTTTTSNSHADHACETATSRFLMLLRRGGANCDVSGKRVLLGVSGGADSVALLSGMHALAIELKLQLVVGHFHHGLRGAAAEADARWTAQLSRCLNCEFVLGRAEPDGPPPTDSGVEEFARAARYRFFEATARAQHCGLVAVAHTADDQVETILHHVLRGTGLAGLRGMPHDRELAHGIRLVRPLLAVRRAEVEAYLGEIDQDWRTDATNRDTAFTRNLLRQELLPQLRAEFNPRIDDALLRLGRQAEEHQAALEYAAREIIERALVDRTGGSCRLDCRMLAGLPRHLVRESLVQTWRVLDWPRQRMGFDDWDRLAGLVWTESAISLPEGINARRSGPWLAITRR